ncbi:hypothetical protein KSF73_13520 [Burkholderiaceae bacterium DAT-1]|nr:hypothetical protein [Burkholderiaceae bacterium DAT-1]
MAIEYCIKSVRELSDTSPRGIALFAWDDTVRRTLTFPETMTVHDDRFDDRSALIQLANAIARFFVSLTRQVCRIMTLGWYQPAPTLLDQIKLEVKWIRAEDSPLSPALNAA